MPDARGGLADHPFTWQTRRDGSIAIQWRGQAARTVSGFAAAKLQRQLDAGDTAAQQQALAKATGKFKRGNERS
ncbi:MAG: hypothetical protein AAF499_02555 [Pseudomonadota bacterium]